MLTIISRSSRNGTLLRDRNPIRSVPVWLLVYIGLFTSLLAIFLFILTRVQLETVPPKRAYQNIVADLYQKSLSIKEQEQLDWLKVENTLTKGVKLSLDYQLLQDKNLFDSAQANINPQQTPYLREIANLISRIDLPQSSLYYQRWVDNLQRSGMQVEFFVRIEGHTDAHPLRPGSRFKDNVELSSYRAYAVMDFLRLYSRLPKRYFTIAGYGSFHPLVEDPYSAENRRVEIYLLPKLKLETLQMASSANDGGGR